jgi:hypothetical protein
MNTSKAPNRLFDPVSRKSAYAIRYLLNGFGIVESYTFDEKGTTRTGIHVVFLLHQFNLQESQPLFEYLPLPEDARAELETLWQRELKRPKSDLYVSDFKLFCDGVKICCSCWTKATCQSLKNRIAALGFFFFCMNEMFFCHSLVPMLLISLVVL